MIRYIFFAPLFLLIGMSWQPAVAQMPSLPACTAMIQYPDDEDGVAAAVDIDKDNDGLIEICDLEGVDEIRYQLDGSGYTTSSSAITITNGCPVIDVDGNQVERCSGYELVKSLDFNANDSYRSTSNKVVWTTGKGWQPIDNNEKPFNSTFSANSANNTSLTISNLMIHRPDEDFVGLFARTRGRILGVRLLNVDIKGKSTVGGIAGFAMDASLIVNSSVEGQVVGTGLWVGGMVGVQRGLIISGYAKGSVEGHASVGGLAGHNSVGTISNSFASVDVKGSDAWVGGMVGYQDRGSIINSYATGDVTGMIFSGGLVGYQERGSIVNSYATGDVEGRHDTGSLVGYTADSITNSYATGDAKGVYDTGGLVGENDGQITNSYAMGAVEGTMPDLGGLVAHNKGSIMYSYATGLVTGTEDIVRGLVGNGGNNITASYWDTVTSMQTTSVGGEGKTTGDLQEPTAANGIYSDWSDNDWDFGDSRHYPALRYAKGPDGNACNADITTSSALPRCGIPLPNQRGRDKGLAAVFFLADNKEAAVELTPLFSPLTDSYNVKLTIPNSSDANIQLRPYAINNTATITITDQGGTHYFSDKPSGELSDEIPLAEEKATTLAIAVADIIDTTYTFAITIVRVSPLAILSIRIPDTINEGSTATLMFMVTGSLGAYEYEYLLNGDLLQSSSTPSITFTMPENTVDAQSIMQTVELKITVGDRDGIVEAVSTTTKITVVKVNNDRGSINNIEFDGNPSRLRIIPIGTDEDGEGDLTMQWQKRGPGEGWTDIPDATTATYWLPAQSNGSIFYRAVNIEYTDGQGYKKSYPMQPPAGSFSTSIDDDGDDLIDIYYLENLNAMRDQFTAMPTTCGINRNQECRGFELRRSLDFNADASYSSTSNKVIWTTGAGWQPIGDDENPFSGTFFANSTNNTSLTISNLMIHRPDEDFVGLFAATDGSRGGIISGVRLLNANVKGRFGVGGIIGLTINESLIAYSSVEGQVTGSDARVGGMVGAHYGSIINSYAKANVKGHTSVGGLVGYSFGLISNSYASVDVEAKAYSGGLVGYNHRRADVGDVGGSITNSYASGSVYSGFSVGGLVGHNNRGILNDVYARVNVVGSADVGGLVGYNDADGHINNGYAVGVVSGGVRVGGLVGYNDSRGTMITNSYWDVETSSVEKSAGGSAKTTAELQSSTSTESIYVAWDERDWNFGSEDTPKYPTLKYSEENYNFGDDNRLNDIYGFSICSTDVGLPVCGTDLPDQGQPGSPGPLALKTLTLSAGVLEPPFDPTKTYYEILDIPESQTDVTVTAAANISAASVAINSQRSMQTTIELNTIGSTIADGIKIVLTATNHTTKLYTIILSEQPLLTAAPSAPCSVGDIDSDDNGLIEICDLEGLYAIRYQPDGSGYKANVNANTITTGCAGSGCIGYELIQNLDFGNANHYRDSDNQAIWTVVDYEDSSDRGWRPLGTFADPFKAKFNGNGYTISNLAINRSDSDYVGLFGNTTSDTKISNVGLPMAQVNGRFIVGGLVGGNDGGSIEHSYISGDISASDMIVGGLVGMHRGYINNSYAQGTVLGNRTVGGLVGSYNAGLSTSTIINSYATNNVRGRLFVGGLVGNNGSVISNSYASGMATGIFYIGGLVSLNIGTIKNSYANGKLIGSFGVGGLVGENRAHIENSYASGAVSGALAIGGLVGRQDSNSTSSLVVNGYWDKETSGISTSAGSLDANGLPTNELQSSTGLAGWSSDDWYFADGHYPILKYIDGDDATNPACAADTSTIANTGLPQCGTLLSNQNFTPLTVTDIDGVAQADEGDILMLSASLNGGSGHYSYQWIQTPENSMHLSAKSALTLSGTNTAALNVEIPSDFITTNVAVTNINITFKVVVSDDIFTTSQSKVVTINKIDNGGPEIRVDINPSRLRIIRATTDPDGVGEITNIQWQKLELGGSWMNIDRATTATYWLPADANDTTLYRVDLRHVDGQKYVTNPRQGPFRTKIDYNDDGLIDIYYLEELNAIRGQSDNLPSTCGTSRNRRCVGFALRRSLDFNDNASYSSTSNKVIWTADATAMNPGWPPINEFSSQVFDGSGYTISNLYINGGSKIGLYSQLPPGVEIKNVGLLDVNVQGSDRVGGLVGDNEGKITNSYVTTATVVGSSKIGGLAGNNMQAGEIISSFANVMVTGDSETGGLAGSNNGLIINSNAEGTASGVSEVGGLVGRHNGSIINSYATANVEGVGTSSNHIGGLVGFVDGDGSIASAYAEGGVSGVSEVGGLVGRHNGSITNSYATANVEGVGMSSNHIGGLVGFVDGDGSIASAYAEGTASGVSEVGGLVGRHSGSMINSYAIGNVEGAGTSSNHIGGLVGLVDGDGSIASAYAEGIASGVSEVGGLVGRHSGSMIDSYATGNIEGVGTSSNHIGGLVGLVDGNGSIANTYAEGTASGVSEVGGLVGTHNGLMINSYAIGNTTGTENIGGLAGFVAAKASIINTYAEGGVSGVSEVGGLVGRHQGSIANSYAIGVVTGSLTNVGGLVGVKGSTATITASYWDIETSTQTESAGGGGKTTEELQSPTAPGTTTTAVYYRWNTKDWDFGDSTHYPALRYADDGDVNACTTAITTSTVVSPCGILLSNQRDRKGLAALFFFAGGKETMVMSTPLFSPLTFSYTVTILISEGLASSIRLRPYASNNTAPIAITKQEGTKNYFATKPSGALSDTITLATETNLTLVVTDIIDGTPVNTTYTLAITRERPSFEVSRVTISPLTIDEGVDIDIDFDVSGGSGDYRYAYKIIDGVDEQLVSQSPPPFVYTVPSDFLEADINTKTVVLKIAVNDNEDQTFEHTENLIIQRVNNSNPDIELDINPARLRLIVTDPDGVGEVTNIQWQKLELGGSWMNIDRATTTTYWLPADADESTLYRAVGVEHIDGQGYGEILATQGPFRTSIDNDGDGLIDIYYLEELNAIRGQSENLPLTCGTSRNRRCVGFALRRSLDFNVDASYISTDNKVIWTADATAMNPGWPPINEFSSRLFDGNDYTISNLYINGGSRIGLYSQLPHSVKIKNIGLLDVNIKGNSIIGGMVGENSGAIISSYVTGAVTGAVSGGRSIGGLVGENFGSISDSNASSRVEGDSFVGGLTGNSTGKIINSYATGLVSGTTFIGGLVGNNKGLIINSYATGLVRGTALIGGLAGHNSIRASIKNAYAEGAVSGSHIIGGLVGENANLNSIINSYATGLVRGVAIIGGLVGSGSRLHITASYWDIETSEQPTSVGGEGKTTTELQSPTAATGIYHDWSIHDWDFGNSKHYPALRYTEGDDLNACTTDITTSTTVTPCGILLPNQRDHKGLAAVFFFADSQETTVTSTPIFSPLKFSYDMTVLIPESLEPNIQLRPYAINNTAMLTITEQGTTKDYFSDKPNGALSEKIILNDQTTLTIIVTDTIGEDTVNTTYTFAITRLRVPLLKVSEVTISPRTVNEGDTATVMFNVTGGSGDYEYAYRIKGQPLLQLPTPFAVFEVASNTVNVDKTTQTVALQIIVSDDAGQTLEHTENLIVRKVDNGRLGIRLDISSSRLRIIPVGSDPDGSGSFTLQWQMQHLGELNWMDIDGATTATYELPTEADGSILYRAVKIKHIDGQGYTVNYPMQGPFRPGVIMATSNIGGGDEPVEEGGELVLEAPTVRGGKEPYRYEWTQVPKNDMHLSGKSALTLISTNTASLMVAIPADFIALNTATTEIRFKVVVDDGISTISRSKVVTIHKIDNGFAEIEISGTTRTLTAIVGADPDGNADDLGYEYQWQQCLESMDCSVEMNWENIMSATAVSYRIADKLEVAGSEFRVKVTYTDGQGYRNDDGLNSNTIKYLPGIKIRTKVFLEGPLR